MAANVSIEIDAKRLLANLEAYPKKTLRASIRSINRAAKSGKTAVSRVVAKDMGFKVGDVKKAISFSPATELQPRATLAASLKGIPLIKFKAKGPKPSRGKGPGVTYKKPDGGRGRAPHAFIATMPSGHEGVFQRKGSAGRLPIRQLYGPSIGSIFDKHKDVAFERAGEQFVKEMNHELDRIEGR